MTKPLEELIHELTPARQIQVREFVETLLIKQKQSPQPKLKQNWAGALQHYRTEYTSLELQDLASTWRTP
jgi:hypothetical protein